MSKQITDLLFIISQVFTNGSAYIRTQPYIINSVVRHLNVYVGKERMLCFWVAMLVAPSFDVVARVVMTTQP